MPTDGTVFRLASLALVALYGFVFGFCVRMAADCDNNLLAAWWWFSAAVAAAGMVINVRDAFRGMR